MIQSRPKKANPGSPTCSLAKSLLTFSLACLCLQNVVGMAMPPIKETLRADITGSPQTAKSVADRLAAQNALFQRQYEDELRASPESETARGDYRDNALLDDYSLAASVKQNGVDPRISGQARGHFYRGVFPSRIVSRTTSCFMFWTIA